MRKLSLVILFLSSIAGADDWFCKTESSRIQGDSIYACGVGTSEDEGQARAEALENAQSEFNHLCTTTCQNSSPEPKRTTCEQSNGKYKCYRLVIFTKEIIAKGEVAIKNTFAKIQKHMSKKQVLEILGAPIYTSEIDTYPGTVQLLHYNGDMCYSGICTVILEKDLVTSYIGVKD